MGWDGMGWIESNLSNIHLERVIRLRADAINVAGDGSPGGHIRTYMLVSTTLYTYVIPKGAL